MTETHDPERSQDPEDVEPVDGADQAEPVESGDGAEPVEGAAKAEHGEGAEGADEADRGTSVAAAVSLEAGRSRWARYVPEPPATQAIDTGALPDAGDDGELPPAPPRPTASAPAPAGTPPPPGSSADDAFSIPLTSGWMLAAVAAALIAFALGGLRATEPPPPPPPPPPVAPPAAGCSAPPLDSEAWMAMTPSPAPVSCDDVQYPSHERNNNDRARFWTFQHQTLALDGRHLVYLVFAEVGRARFSTDDRAYLVERTQVALGALARWARRFEGNCFSAALGVTTGGVPVRYRAAGRTALRTIPFAAYERSIAGQIRASMAALPEGPETLHHVAEQTREAFGVTSVAFLVFVPKEGRSYATSTAYAEYAVHFAPPRSLAPELRYDHEATIAHEFMHLIGADDLYDVRQAADWQIRSLMNLRCPSLQELHLDPFTEFAAGLGDGYGSGGTPPPTPFPVVDDRGAFIDVR